MVNIFIVVFGVCDLEIVLWQELSTEGKQDDECEKIERFLEVKIDDCIDHVE